MSVEGEGSEFSPTTYNSEVENDQLNFGGFFKFTRTIVGYAPNGQPTKKMATTESVAAIRTTLDGKLDKTDVVDPTGSDSVNGKAASALDTKNALEARVMKIEVNPEYLPVTKDGRTVDVQFV